MILAMCTRKGNHSPKRLAHVKTHQKGKSLMQLSTAKDELEELRPCRHQQANKYQGIKV